MEFFTRFQNAFVLIVVLLTQTIALAVQVRRTPDRSESDSHSVLLLRLWATSIVTPFARSAHSIGGGIRGGWSNYVALQHIRQQNEDLRRQLAAMRLQQTAEAEDVIAGQRLQALLAFREHYVTSTVAAQVIGTSGSEQSRMLLLDKGSSEGLRSDMPVITPDGVVGKLRDVFPHSSQLLLISDASAGAGVMLESTRIRAILRGTPSGRVQIGNLTADSRIQPGEKVLTSGGDQVFPRGLPIGTVESIGPDPEHQPYAAIIVRPAAKLNQLEEVLVITGTQPDLPLQAQQDLVAGAARHEEEVEAAKAAQAAAAANQPRGLDLSGVSADGKTNLPSQENDDKPPAETATQGIVPKPAPVLHPDRYSPGATPSAVELTPGAARTPRTSDHLPSPGSTGQNDSVLKRQEARTGSGHGTEVPEEKTPQTGQRSQAAKPDQEGTR